ncbi:ribosomal protein S18-alanine N-acetyltransferase, partial [Kamptonema animale CS-326]|uniref:ribosomal protein S18-alanine N-acetyltransferase n=1 Tax=Kamptonema animale TaxID=92934 RepID=UPI00232F09BD
AGERGSGGEEEIKEDLASLSSPSLIGIGCLWSILEEAHITILAIHPDYQGQGFGQALLYALLKSAHQQKLEWATLEVRSSNLVAISLYQKFGFQEAGRRRGYYQDSGEDALILWRGSLQKPEFKQDLARWEHEIRDRVSPDLLLQGV